MQIYLTNPVLIISLCNKPPHTVSDVLISKLLKAAAVHPQVYLKTKNTMYKLREYSQDTANEKILKTAVHSLRVSRIQAYSFMRHL